jgi:hypothetical protein
MFPELCDDKVVSNTTATATESATNAMVEDAVLNNMVDPNVTMQSLFLPSDLHHEP